MKRSAPLRRKTPLAQPGDRQRANGIGTPRRRAVSPATPAQRAKVSFAGECRVHGSACSGYGLDPAHVVDRSIGGCDDSLCVVPLCRAAHEAYDDHSLDLLSVLSWPEQAHAVEHLGLLRALKRITGSEWVEKLGPEVRL